MSVRRDFGQSTVEILCGFVIFVPLILLAIDLVTVYSGYSLNSRVCRDAARAASSGPPNALAAGSPKQRADGVIRDVYNEVTVKKYNVLGTVHLHPDCVVTDQLTAPIPDSSLGGPIDGQVTVETTVDVIPPFLIKEFVGPKGISLTASQTFPYTYIVPSTNSTNR
jgi:Flp pilus assembly protein TadG